MNHTELEKQKIAKIVSGFDLTEKFDFVLVVDSTGTEGIELTSLIGKKVFKIAGCFPFLFCSSNRHVMLESKERAQRFFEFEKVNISQIKIKRLEIDFSSSALKIETELFSVTMFPNEMWGWGIQYEGENYILEALEFGGIEVRL